VTEITRTHAEWAVVDRLRSMLNEAPHAEYNVTQSYGLCVAILAWVMQRIRTPEGQVPSPEDQAVRSVKQSLDQQLVDALPWGLKTNGPSAQGPGHGEFKDFTAFEFLKWLRDAACHGDARQIFPVNHGGRLTGFEFRPTVRGGKERSLVLTERDLRRIGSGLASLYCDALQSAASTSPGQFTDDARSMREQRKAA
jgi:hypothetical protein